MPHEVATNVTIKCVECGKEIWQEAPLFTTLGSMKNARCSDCYLDKRKKETNK